MAYTPHHKRDPDHKKRERYERLTLGTAVVGVIVVAISTMISAWNTILMRGQLTAMEAQQRPWLNGEPMPDSDLLGLYWGEDTLYVHLKVKTKNVGQAVGEGIRIETALVAVPNFGSGIHDVEAIETESRSVIDAQNAVCDELSDFNPWITPKTFGDTLFPGEERSNPEWVGLDVNKIKQGLAKAKVDSFIPIIAGCIDYRFYVTSTHHQTRFAYIARSQDETPYESHAIKVGQEISGKKLVFDKYLWGNGSAD